MASQHTAEFRQEAVRVALTSGLKRKQVASDFGVGFSTLSRWIQLERRELSEPTAQSDLEAEVTRLRKENRLLREEREVLKKATIFFAGQKPWGLDLSKKIEVPFQPNDCAVSWMSVHVAFVLSDLARLVRANVRIWCYWHISVNSTVCPWAAMAGQE